MLVGKSRRWLLAAAVFPLVLAGCASQGAGTGTAGTSAGPALRRPAIGHASAAACCGETAGFSSGHPNVPLPGRTGPGGGPSARTCSGSRYPAAPSARSGQQGPPGRGERGRERLEKLLE